MKIDAQAGIEKWNKLEPIFEQDAALVQEKIEKNYSREWKEFCLACYELIFLGENDNALKMNRWLFTAISEYKNKELEMHGYQFSEVRYQYYLINAAAETQKSLSSS